MGTSPQTCPAKARATTPAKTRAKASAAKAPDNTALKAPFAPGGASSTAPRKRPPHKACKRPSTRLAAPAPRL